jgi:hypothetical protein
LKDAIWAKSLTLKVNVAKFHHVLGSQAKLFATATQFNHGSISDRIKRVGAVSQAQQYIGVQQDGH